MWLFSRKKKEGEKPKSRSEVDRGSSIKSGPVEMVGEKIKAAAPAVKLPEGDDAQSYRVILKPRITEKGTTLEKQGKYLFKVAKNANKIEIKSAIEKLYKVKVRKIHVLSMPSKFRQVGKYKGRKPGFKKAIVTLKEGSKIDLAS